MSTVELRSYFSWLVLLLMCIALVGIVMPAGAVAEQGPCQTTDSSETTALLLLPGASTPESGTVELHPETTAFVLLCEDGQSVPTEDGDRWSVNETEGISEATAEQARWRIVLGTRDQPIATEDIVEGQEVSDGAVIATVSAGVTESNLDDVDSVAFGDSDTKAAYEDAERDYLDAREELNDDLDELEDVTETVRAEGLRDSTYSSAIASLEELEETLGSQEDSTTTMKHSLFDAAFAVHPAAEHNVAALNAIAESTDTTHRETEQQLESYSDVIERERATAERTIELFVLPGVLVGAILGVSGAAVVTRRRAKAYRRTKHVDEDASYEIRDFDRYLMIGLVTAVVGLGLLLYSGNLTMIVPFMVIV